MVRVMTPKTALGEYLAQLMIDSDLRLPQVAAAVGVSRTLIYGYLFGLRPMPAAHLTKFFDAVPEIEDRDHAIAKAFSLWQKADVEVQGFRLGLSQQFIDDLVSATEDTAVGQSAMGAVLEEMQRLFHAADQRAKRSQWRFFVFGALLSIPIGILINLFI